MNELSATELARALAANGRDTLNLLLTSPQDGRETVVGEARVAISYPERAGEFSLPIADAASFRTRVVACKDGERSSTELRTSRRNRG